MQELSGWSTLVFCVLSPPASIPLNFGSHPERSLVVKLVIKVSMPKFGELSQKVNFSSYTSFTLHCSASNTNLVTFSEVGGEKSKKVIFERSQHLYLAESCVFAGTARRVTKQLE